MFQEEINVYHSQRYQAFKPHSRRQGDTEGHRSALQAVTLDAIQQYIDTWKNDCWPTVVRFVYMRCLQWCSQKDQCILCTKPWGEGKHFSHGLFDCEKLQKLRQRSYDKFGPGTECNVDVQCDQWLGCIQQMASNPLSEKAAGKLHCVRLAYLATVLSYYKQKTHISMPSE